jgi:hypothetical protein
VYSPTDTDTVDLECFCALGEAGRTPTPKLADPGVGAGEAADLRFHRILDAVKWPAAPRLADDVNTPVIATIMGQQAADLLAALAASVCGSVYGDRQGNVVLRGRDWQTTRRHRRPHDRQHRAGDVCPSGSSSRATTWSPRHSWPPNDRRRTQPDDAAASPRTAWKCSTPTTSPNAETGMFDVIARRPFRARAAPFHPWWKPT